MSYHTSDVKLDKIRRKAALFCKMFEAMDKYPILERIEALEEVLEALEEALPPEDRMARYTEENDE